MMKRTHRSGLLARTFLAALLAACAPAANDEASVEVSLQIGAGTIGLSPGEAVQLNAAPLDATGAPVSGLYTMSWTSASAAVATVTPSGLLTGVAVGTTTITATAKIVATGATATASAKITVSTAAPLCGDGVCSSKESCTSCAADCGTCPTTTFASVFASNVAPTDGNLNDGKPIETGMKLRTTVGGAVTALRYYKGAGSTGTRVGHLWSATGSLLATATFVAESASGWQQVQLSSPVMLTPGKTYVVSVFSPTGAYASTHPYFTQAVVSGPLRALADGEDGPNGVYVYTSGAAMPTASYASSNYYVDVVFAASGAAPAPDMGSGSLDLARPADMTPVQGASRKNLLFESTFEGITDWVGAIGADGYHHLPVQIGEPWTNEQHCCANSIGPAPQARTGSTAIRFELRKGDPDVSGSKRAEISGPSDVGNGSERWFGMSVFVTANDDGKDQSVMQWHNLDFNTSPPLILNISGNTWQLVTSRDGNGNAPSNTYTNIAPVVPGVWHDIVVHAKFSNTSQGLTELWLDGVKKATVNGPNCYQGTSGYYLKYGIYKWSWAGLPADGSSRVIYEDDIRIGNAAATYADVAP